MENDRDTTKFPIAEDEADFVDEFYADSEALGDE